MLDRHWLTEHAKNCARRILQKQSSNRSILSLHDFFSKVCYLCFWTIDVFKDFGVDINDILWHPGGEIFAGGGGDHKLHLYRLMSVKFEKM